jgi:hypothetical protein
LCQKNAGKTIEQIQNEINTYFIRSNLRDSYKTGIFLISIQGITDAIQNIPVLKYERDYMVPKYPAGAGVVKYNFHAMRFRCYKRAFRGRSISTRE